MDLEVLKEETKVEAEEDLHKMVKVLMAIKDMLVHKIQVQMEEVVEHQVVETLVLEVEELGGQ